MIVRRIRGVLTTATIWGLASSLTIIAFTSVFALADGRQEPARRLLRDLADLLPSSFTFGATSGALFALLVAIAEQHQTLASLSERRFRLWGILAGALPISVFEFVLRLGPQHTPWSWGLYSILCGGFTGAYFAPAVLRAARRSALQST